MNSVCGFLTGLLVLASFLSTPCTGQDLGQKAKEASIACSIFGAASTNAKSWSSGDFLFRDHTSFDSVRSIDGKPFGVTVEDVIFRRVVFDVQRGQYMFLLFRKERVLDIGNENLSGPDSQEKVEISGWVINEQTDKYLRFTETGYVDEIQREKLPKEIDVLLSSIQYPEFKGFWLTESLTSTGYLDMIGNRKSGKNFDSSSSNGGQEIVNFKLVRDELGEKNVSLCETFRFDSQSLMPVSYRAYAELKNKVVEGPAREFEWAEYNGVYVPVCYKLKRATTLVVNRKEHSGLSYRNLDFHWFSLNDPEALPKDILDASCFESREALMKFVDPVLANADSLLEGTGTDRGDLLDEKDADGATGGAR